MTNPSVVQSNSQASGSNTFTFTTQNLTVGNTAVVVLAEYDSPTTTITDVKLGSTSVSFTVEEFPQVGGGTAQGVAAIVIPNISVSAQDTVVITYSGTSIIASWGCEVQDLGAAPVLDAFASNDGTGNAITTGTSSPATTTAGAFVLAAAASYTGTSSSPTETWTNKVLGINSHLSIGWEIQTTSGQTYSWSQATTGGATWAAFIIVLRAASSGTSPKLIMAAGLV